MTGARDYTLRPATSGDFEFVRELYLESWGEPAQGFLEKWFKPERMKIILVGGKDVGLLVVEKRPSELFLESISVSSALQSRGLGASVIKDVLEDAEVSRLPVVLEVLKPNPARRLHERLGFRVVDENATHLQMKWQPTF